MRNIGIFAHVDAGKTTLSEQLLLKAGAIRSAGSVDSGTAHTDTLPVERRRGISVRSSCVRLTWRGEAINLIDTPGHVDFSAEIERALWALDGAVRRACSHRRSCCSRHCGSRACRCCSSSTRWTGRVRTRRA